MATVSISEAARLVGVSRKTIQRHIDTGKLSATVSQEDVAGRLTPLRQVETSELLRVYGKFTTSDVAPDGETRAPQLPTLSTQNDPMSQVVEAQQETIDVLKRQVDELTIEKKELRAQVAGILEYRKPPPVKFPRNYLITVGVLATILIAMAIEVYRRF
jgi:predicted transcriptional regulator